MLTKTIRYWADTELEEHTTGLTGHANKAAGTEN
jgi:hypothetical protein